MLLLFKKLLIDSIDRCPRKAPHIKARILKIAVSKRVAFIQCIITKKRLVYKNCVCLIATVLSFNKQRGFSCLRCHLVTYRLRSPCSEQNIFLIHSGAVFFLINICERSLKKTNLQQPLYLTQQPQKEQKGTRV